MYTKYLNKTTVFVIALSFFAFTSCNNNDSNSKTNSTDSAMNADTSKQSAMPQPKGPKPDWAPNMNPQMQVVIEKLMSFNNPPLPKLSAPEARKLKSAADATKEVMTDNKIPMPPSTVDTTGKDIPVSGGNIHLRIYSPKGNGPFPVIVYYHGGGWVIADLDTYDASARALAEQTGAVLVSVAYRQGPEHKFPTAHMDSYAAYEWVLKNTAEIKGDAKHIAVAGESAGGGLAAAVSMMARDKGVALPVHELLVYPIAGYDFNTPSYQKNANAKPLDKGGMQWFFKNYLNSPADGKSPMIDLVNANLKGLPSTTIITDEYDPLMSEGQMLSDKLKAAGVSVSYKNYDGVTHEFFGMATVVPAAKDAQAFASGELKKALGK